jgi:hypothetical protein
MPSLISRRMAVLAIAWLVSGALLTADGEPGFRRFAHTVSPDGAYVLAWGWGEDEANLAALKEWPDGKDTYKEGAIANYLVDAAGGRVLKTIPDHDHYVTSDGRFKPFSGLTLAWAEDGQKALAIYSGRFEEDSVVWIDPKQKTSVEMLGPLHQACVQFITKTEQFEEEALFWIEGPALLPGGVVVFDARAKVKVTEPAESWYRFKFQVKIEGEEAKCRMLIGRKIPKPRTPADVEDETARNALIEEELNRANAQLLAKVKASERAALKEKQLAWLKQRETVGASQRVLFTQLRTAYLRARAEN